MREHEKICGQQTVKASFQMLTKYFLDKKVAAFIFLIDSSLFFCTANAQCFKRYPEIPLIIRFTCLRFPYLNPHFFSVQQML